MLIFYITREIVSAPIIINMEHLVIIIDKDKNIEPKKYSCKTTDKTEEEAVNAAKKSYEQKYKNKNYESYHFTH